MTGKFTDVKDWALMYLSSRLTFWKAQEDGYLKAREWPPETEGDTYLRFVRSEIALYNEYMDQVNIWFAENASWRGPEDALPEAGQAAIGGGTWQKLE